MYKENQSWDLINIRDALMTWIIHQTLFCQNVEIENSPNFNDVKVSWYTVYSSILWSYSYSSFIHFLYNNSPLSFLNAQYRGVTTTFSIEGLHLVTNVQVLKYAFYSEMSELYSLALGFLDRFPMMCFITYTKATPIINVGTYPISPINIHSILKMFLDILQSTIPSSTTQSINVILQWVQ